MYYNGAYKDGKKDGKGHYKLKGMVEYEGQFKEDEFHGYGKLTNIQKKSFYEGTFKMGEKEGKGELKEGGGGIYEG